MSIMQDYEQARKSIGKEKYDAIELYLDEICPKRVFNKYEKELKDLDNSDPQEWSKKKKELEKKYGIVFLSDVLYNPEEWNKFESWYEQKSRKYIIEMWENNADRNDGFGQIIEENIEDLGQAIKKAKEFFETSECVSIEVQKAINREAVYFRDKIGEKYFVKINKENERVAVKSGYYFDIFNKNEVPDELKKADYQVQLEEEKFDLYQGNTLEQERMIDNMFKDKMGFTIKDHIVECQEEEEDLDEP